MRRDEPKERWWDPTEAAWHELDHDKPEPPKPTRFDDELEARGYISQEGEEYVIDPETGTLERRRDIWPH